MGIRVAKSNYRNINISKTISYTKAVILLMCHVHSHDQHMHVALVAYIVISMQQLDAHMVGILVIIYNLRIIGKNFGKFRKENG